MDIMDTGGVSDRKRSGRPRVVRTPQVINAVRSRINRNRKKKIKTPVAVTLRSVTNKSSLQMKKKNTVEETFNKRNDRVYARSSKEAR